MLAPSKATPIGPVPTAKVPSVVPSLARSLVTLLLLKFATQMLVPSKATPIGAAPTLKEFGWLPPCQESRPTWSGLKYFPDSTPLAANWSRSVSENWSLKGTAAVQGWAVKTAKHPSRFSHSRSAGDEKAFREYPQHVCVEFSGLLVLFLYP